MVAGAAIIIMGLHFLGVFRIGLLYREARVSVEKPVGLWGAYVMGLAFAFGWTPCIGPILASILAVAGRRRASGRARSFSRSIPQASDFPFILAAFAMKPFAAFMKRMRSRLPLVEKAMGCLLVLTGIAFFSGWMADASFWLLETFPALGRLG